MAFCLPAIVVRPTWTPWLVYVELRNWGGQENGPGSPRAPVVTGRRSTTLAQVPTAGLAVRPYRDLQRLAEAGGETAAGQPGRPRGRRAGNEGDVDAGTAGGRGDGSPRAARAAAAASRRQAGQAARAGALPHVDQPAVGGNGRRRWPRRVVESAGGAGGAGHRHQHLGNHRQRQHRPQRSSGVGLVHHALRPAPVRGDRHGNRCRCRVAVHPTIHSVWFIRMKAAALAAAGSLSIGVGPDAGRSSERGQSSGGWGHLVVQRRRGH